MSILDAPAKLRQLADWMDNGPRFGDMQGDEVQRDLRHWADEIERLAEPATPEGGQPADLEFADPKVKVEARTLKSPGGQPIDDELLARAENDPISLSDSDVAELASVLRRQRYSLTELMSQRDYFADRLSARFGDVLRLRLELAEARSHGEVLYRGPWHHLISEYIYVSIPDDTDVLVVRADRETGP